MNDVFTRNGLLPAQFAGMSVEPHKIEGHIFEVAGAIYRRLDSWRNAAKDDSEISDPLMRYIIYMYDESTPLMKSFPDINKRMKVAFELAGLTDKPHRQQISKGKLRKEKIMAFDFLKVQKNMLWNLIVTNENMFDECLKTMMETTTADKDKDLLMSLKIKQDVAKNMDEIHERISKYLRKFYNDDDILQSSHNVVSQRMSSEGIADMMGS